MVYAGGGGGTREKSVEQVKAREYNYPLAMENKLKEKRGAKVEVREQSEKNKKERERKELREREKRRSIRARR